MDIAAWLLPWVAAMVRPVASTAAIAVQMPVRKVIMFPLVMRYLL